VVRAQDATFEVVRSPQRRRSRGGNEGHLGHHGVFDEGHFDCGRGIGSFHLEIGERRHKRDSLCAGNDTLFSAYFVRPIE